MRVCVCGCVCVCACGEHTGSDDLFRLTVQCGTVDSKILLINAIVAKAEEKVCHDIRVELDAYKHFASTTFTDRTLIRVRFDCVNLLLLIVY